MIEVQKYAELLAAGKLFPKPEPDGETTVAESPAFVDACTSTVSELAAKHDLILGESTLTHSDVWGLVWRIDFTAKDNPGHSGILSRYICWGSSDGTIFGTALVPVQKRI